MQNEYKVENTLKFYSNHIKPNTLDMAVITKIETIEQERFITIYPSLLVRDGANYLPLNRFSEFCGLAKFSIVIECNSEYIKFLYKE